MAEPVDTSSMSDTEILDSSNEDLGLVAELKDENEEIETTDEETEVAEEVEEEAPELDEAEEQSDEVEEVEGSPVSFGAIKKEYPEFFKKFPDMARVVSTAQQFEAEFATVEEAKEVKARLNGYDHLAGQIVSGDPLALLKTVNDAQGFEAVRKFSHNFIPALRAANPELFFEVTSPLVIGALKHAQQAAKIAGNKDLYHSVRHISHYLFENADIDKIEVNARPQRAPAVDPEKQNLIRERGEFIKGRAIESMGEINTQIKTEVGKLVSAELKGILKNSTDYVRNKVRDDIITELDNLVAADPNFLKTQRSLLARAARTGFTDKATLAKIKNAFLERSRPNIAKTVRTVLAKNKLVAFKGPQAKGDSGNLGSGNRSQSKTGNINSKNIDYSKTSDMDIINGNITQRK